MTVLFFFNSIPPLISFAPFITLSYRASRVGLPECVTRHDAQVLYDNCIVVCLEALPGFIHFSFSSFSSIDRLSNKGAHVFALMSFFSTENAVQVYRRTLGYIYQRS